MAIKPHWAVTIENPEGAGGAVIACDHASNHIPDKFASLGLTQADLMRHIAWDPGALGVARSLARRLDAPLVASAVSRLVIDCNRAPSDFDSIATQSEDTKIPGNEGLSEADRAWRIAEVYEPFHRALAGVMAGREASGGAALVSIHSYTPVYRGVSRPWHAGVLFDRDRRLADVFLKVLQHEKGLVVGENQPYSPKDRVYHTLDRHAQSQGVPSAMIEIRNDLIRTEDEQEKWAEILARALQSVEIKQGA